MFDTAGENHLPKLDIASTKRTGAGVQVIAEHPFKTLGIVIGDFRRGTHEAFVPCHQRGIVIRAKIMPVFHHKMRLAGVGNLAN